MKNTSTRIQTAGILVLCVLLAIALIACDNQASRRTGKTGEPHADLTNTKWQVVEMIDVTTGSDMAKEFDNTEAMEIAFSADGSLCVQTPLNTLSGAWKTDGSSLEITLGEPKVVSADYKGDYQLLIIDGSMGTALVQAQSYLLAADGQSALLSLFDEQGRMVMRCRALNK
jgi:hypothetical protein